MSLHIFFLFLSVCLLHIFCLFSCKSHLIAYLIQSNLGFKEINERHKDHLSHYILRLAYCERYMYININFMSRIQFTHMHNTLLNFQMMHIQQMIVDTHHPHLKFLVNLNIL